MENLTFEQLAGMKKDEIAKLLVQASAENKQLKESKPTGRFIVKHNAKGGVYIAHPSFQSWSEDKQKQYTANINFKVGVGEALFLNEKLLAEVVKAMKALPRHPVLNNIK